MQEELENWLIFSHCRVFTRRWQFYGNWNSGKDWTLLEQLSEKTDKNILVYDANESGGYYPLAGAQSDNLLELGKNLGFSKTKSLFKIIKHRFKYYGKSSIYSSAVRRRRAFFPTN